MPWEVGKMLLQVQWVPRDAGEPVLNAETVEEEEELSDNDDSYFTDPSNTSGRHPASRPADGQGYILRRSVLEEGMRPEYIIPIGSADGVWGMIKCIGRFRGEGWLALWKGLLTSFVTDVLSSNIQPLLLNVLQSIFLPSLSPFQQPPLILPVASHLLTGFILSPLDLVRTRLVIQSFSPRHRTYTGPLDAFTQILQHEGGIRGMYLHPHLLIPTLLDNTLRPLVSLALPGLVTSYLGTRITEDTNPITWAFAELIGSCVGLLITLPFETVRRRLQAQTRGSAKPIKSCVELRPAPYNGVVDAIWHILTEERSDLPVGRMKGGRRVSSKGKENDRSDEIGTGRWIGSTGIAQLYRGFGMRLGASGIVFLLGVLTGGEDRDGWAEL